jgi:glycine/D-amino acid oxidase-like deaminating enzyme
MSDFGTPYWWEDGAPLPDLPTVPPEAADLVIVGAGYTGLVAAITARRAGASVALIDAAVPGQGASTRNGGMFGPHPRLSYDQMCARFGAETAVDVFNESPQALGFTRRLIEDEGIACDFQITGRVLLAWTKSDFAAQKKLARDLRQNTAYHIDVLERSELAPHIATAQYFGALYFADHAALQPRKFHDGLMAIALSEGVQVVQNCRVLDISKRGSKTGSGFDVQTRGGSIRAGKVIAATGGYTNGGGIFPWLRRRVFPLPSFIIATEPLPPEMIAELAPGRRMMVESRAKHSYYRISPDGTRILMGGRASMVPVGPELAARRLKRTLCEIWPQLSSTAITHSWRGFTGYSFTHTPYVGVKEGIHYAMGYSGSGVVMAPYLGMKVAYRALGDPRGDTVFTKTALQTRLYHPGSWPLFLAPGEFWYRQIIDRVETARAARDRAG